MHERYIQNNLVVNKVERQRQNEDYHKYYLLTQIHNITSIQLTLLDENQYTFRIVLHFQAMTIFKLNITIH